MPPSVSGANLARMKALRLLIGVLAASAVVASLALVALAAPASVQRATAPQAAAAAVYCPPGEKARRKAVAKRYQQKMPATRKAYFRRTRSVKLRKVFVQKQTAQLKALQRLAAACK